MKRKTEMNMVFFIGTIFNMGKAFLLFPGASVLQMTISLSIPITDLTFNRRAFFDWGLQMNFDVPFNVSSFYNKPIFPDYIDTVNRAKLRKKRKFWNSQGKNSEWADYTAGEFYKTLRGMFKRFGFNESCLQLSICELTLLPFADIEDNFLSNIITFIFSPSIHNGFSRSDSWNIRLSAESAAKLGYHGVNCTQLYPDCLNGGILKLISNIV